MLDELDSVNAIQNGQNRFKIGIPECGKSLQLGDKRVVFKEEGT